METRGPPPPAPHQNFTGGGAPGPPLPNTTNPTPPPRFDIASRRGGGPPRLQMPHMTPTDDAARRAYWTEQMELGYELVQKIIAFEVRECGEGFASLRD